MGRGICILALGMGGVSKGRDGEWEGGRGGGVGVNM